MSSDPKEKAKLYWSSCLRILFLILSIWFVAAYVCGILCREWLDLNFPNIGNAPFGFWMAQQGSIIVFMGLLVLYRFLMNRLDAEYSYGEESK